jgi:hypothetical protein
MGQCRRRLMLTYVVIDRLMREPIHQSVIVGIRAKHAYARRDGSPRLGGQKPNMCRSFAIGRANAERASAGATAWMAGTSPAKTDRDSGPMGDRQIDSQRHRRQKPFLNSLTENQNYGIVTYRWTKGASHADGKRPFPPRMAKTKG